MSATDQHDVGMVAYEEGDYETAIAAFQEARRVWREIGDTYAEADSLMSEGVAHTRMKNYDRAEDAYSEALALFTQIDSTEGQATVMGNLGTLLYMQGDAARAIGYLDRASDLFYELGESDREAETLQMLARAYLSKLDWVNSLLAYDRALSRMDSLTGQQKFLRMLCSIFLKLIGVNV